MLVLNQIQKNSRELSVIKKLKQDVEIYRNRGSEMEGADKEGASIDAGTGCEERDGGEKERRNNLPKSKKKKHCMKGFIGTTV